MVSDRLGTEEYLRLHQILVVVTKHDKDADSQDDVLESQGNIWQIHKLLSVQRVVSVVSLQKVIDLIPTNYLTNFKCAMRELKNSLLSYVNVYQVPEQSSCTVTYRRNCDIGTTIWCKIGSYGSIYPSFAVSANTVSLKQIGFLLKKLLGGLFIVSVCLDDRKTEKKELICTFIWTGDFFCSYRFITFHFLRRTSSPYLNM